MTNETSGKPHIAVIGAGVVGTACAYYLAKAGCRVTLLDRGTVGGACSHGNCGYVSPSHVLPLAGPGAIWSTLKTLAARNSPLKVRVGTALTSLGWFRRFAARCNEKDMLESAAGIQALLAGSRTLYDDLIREECLDADWDPAGLIFAFRSEKAFEHFKHVNELLAEKFATPAERIGKEELLAREPALKPESVAGGYLYKCDAQLRPDALLREWRSALERRGVTVLENCEFAGFDSQGKTANSIRTSTGTVRADAFVVAAGSWTPLWNDALGCRVPIIPGKGYSITMARPKLCPKLPMIFEEHRVAISPMKSAYRIGSTMEFAGYDATLNRDRLKLLRDGASFYLEEPLGEPVSEEWWGWRPMVYDGKPVIDFSPKIGNVMIAAGHCMLGLSMATGSGKLVSELIMKQTPSIDPAHYSLARFR